MRDISNSCREDFAGAKSSSAILAQNDLSSTVRTVRRAQGNSRFYRPVHPMALSMVARGSALGSAKPIVGMFNRSPSVRHTPRHRPCGIVPRPRFLAIGAAFTVCATAPITTKLHSQSATALKMSAALPPALASVPTDGWRIYTTEDSDGHAQMRIEALQRAGAPLVEIRREKVQSFYWYVGEPRLTMRFLSVGM